MEKRSERIRKALQHANKPGAGAEARREHLKTPEEYMETDMHEFKHGTLHSGSGQLVTKRAQALAIALSEARKAKARQ